MAETLGTLIDKLTIANIRLWHLEDARRDRGLADQDRLAAADAISVVNKERNDLMDEIDEFLYQAAHGQVKLKSPKVKIYQKFRLTEKEAATAEKLARAVDGKKRASGKKRARTRAAKRPLPPGNKKIKGGKG